MGSAAGGTATFGAGAAAARGQRSGHAFTLLDGLGLPVDISGAGRLLQRGAVATTV
jgi:hypothetical protein